MSEDIQVKLGVFAEKVQNLEKNLDRIIESEKTCGDNFRNEIREVRKEVSGICAYVENLLKDYVNKEEFAPVKLAVFGFIGLVLVTVVGAVLSLIIR